MSELPFLYGVIRIHQKLLRQECLVGSVSTALSRSREPNICEFVRQLNFLEPWLTGCLHVMCTVASASSLLCPCPNIWHM